MSGEKTLLNELRLINISMKRSMNSVCGNVHRVPAVSSMVLHFIYLQGGSVMQKQVENEFDLRRSTASQLLRRLELDGYITRIVAESDCRTKRIELSEKAKVEQIEFSRKLREMENYLDSALTQSEKETFFALCEKIRRLLEPSDK